MAVGARVPASFKIDRKTKQRVDLMASALGVDKSRVIEEAVEALAARRKGEMSAFLEQARQSFESSDQAAAERFTGRTRSKKYAGGPVT